MDGEIQNDTPGETGIEIYQPYSAFIRINHWMMASEPVNGCCAQWHMYEIKTVWAIWTPANKYSTKTSSKFTSLNPRSIITHKINAVRLLVINDLARAITYNMKINEK